MAIVRKVVGQITLKVIKDVDSTTYFYLLLPSTAPIPTKPTTNPPPVFTTTGYDGWSETEPNYTSGDTRSLYVTVRTVYSDGSFEYTTPSLSSSYEAAKQAYNRAQSAFTLASDTNQYFWFLSEAIDSDIPAGAYVTSIPSNTFKNNKTGGNIVIQSTGLTIRNGTNQLASLTGSALNFYNPVAESGTNALQLSIGANGALQSGNYSRGEDSKFASAGTRIDLTNGDIITQYFRVSQGLEPGINAGAYIHGVIEAISGKIGAGSTNYWEIGEYTDYNLTTNATMVGHGGSFIQLGDNLTWRLATNRLHTGWYSDGNTTLTYPIIDSKYWDFGVHAPTAKTDKFLYIRNSKDETTSTGVLERLLYDIDDTYTSSQWDYKFYIDGEGNLVTTGTIDAHNISIDGQSIAGGSLVAGSLAAYGGTSTRPVYFPSSGNNQGKPVAVDWDVNSTIEDTATNNGNIATIGALKAYIEGKNYSTTTGTVTSIGLAEGPGIEITGGPVTSSGTITVGHSNSITAGTAGTSSATSGSTLSVPYVTYDSEGHVTAAGVHTHTITGFFVDGNLDANETVITDSTGSLTSRKVVEGYTIVQTLPTADIDTNMVYLIPTEYDTAGGGGEGGTTVLYSLTRSNGSIILNGTDGTSSSVDGGLTTSEVQTLIDETIDPALGVRY